MLKLLFSFPISSVFALSLACVLSSCQAKYSNPPEIATPIRWSQELPAATLQKAISPFDDETLDLLLEIAKSDNFDLKSAAAQIDEARNYYLTQKGALFPQIKASTSANYNHLSKNTINGGAIPPGFSTNLFDLSFNTIWELDFLGKQAIARDSAKASFEAAFETKAALWLSLKADISQTYFTWIAYRLKIQLAKQMVATYENLYQITAERANYKLVSPSQVQASLVALANVQSQLPILLLQSDVSQHTLELLIGKGPGFLKEVLKEPSALPSYPYYPSLGVPSDLLKRRPDIRSAERKLASAAGLTQVAKLDIFPSFMLTGALGQQSMFARDLTKSSNHYWSLMPGLELPVFNAGALKANYKRSQARQAQAVAEYEKCVVKALMEVENALSGINQRNAQENLLSVAMQAQAHILNAQMAKYEQKVSDWAEVLRIQSDFLQAESAWIDAKLNYLNQILFLEKALGGEFSSQVETH